MDGDAEPASGGSRCLADVDVRGVRRHRAAARPAQHVRGQPGQAALRRQRVVAPGRRRDHRPRPDVRPGPAPVTRVDVHRVPQRDRVDQLPSTPSSSACSWPSTPTPATTPPPTSRRRRRTPPSRRPRAWCAASGSRSSPAGCCSSRSPRRSRTTTPSATARRACRRPRSSSTRRGRTLGIFLLFICAVAQFFCGMASVTANSRMSYAFSRDNALPGSRLWAKVNPRTGTPTNSIWLCVTCSLVLAAPALKSLWPTSPSPRSPSSASTSPTSCPSSCDGATPPSAPATGTWAGGAR